MVPSGSEWFRIGSEWFRMDPNGPHMVPNAPTTLIGSELTGWVVLGKSLEVTKIV